MSRIRRAEITVGGTGADPAALATASLVTGQNRIRERLDRRRRNRHFGATLLMSNIEQGTWHQMLFVSPEGRKEALWVEQLAHNEYRVLSVPVWIYGVSVGSIVESEAGDSPQLVFRRVIQPGAGGTVRFIVPRRGTRASQIYLTRVIPDSKRLGLKIGPATFFNPRLVAVHLHERQKWWPEFGGYLDTLVSEGVLEQWEVGDPDTYNGDDDVIEQVTEADTKTLVHPLPVDEALGQDVS